jgi:hypothetical protein
MNDEITARAIIPASPGWYLARLLFGGSDKKCSLVFEPVIAWSIAREEEDRAYKVDPLTVTGNPNDYSEIWALKTPDGKYQIPGTTYGCWNETDTVNALKEFERNEIKQRKEKRQLANAETKSMVNDGER